ncbi:hypothetical protein V2J09_016010, partial [Rumex salicifolius]
KDIRDSRFTQKSLPSLAWLSTVSSYSLDWVVLIFRTKGLRLGALHTCARAETLGKHVQHNMVGAKSGGEEDNEMDEGFSELEVSNASDEHKSNQSDDENELVSETDLSDEDDVVHSPESELKLDNEHDSAKSSSKKKAFSSDLAEALLKEPISDKTALDHFVSEGKTLDGNEILHAISILRRRKLFRKALQFSEWLEEKEVLEFDERFYATRLDLIAKVQGLQKAESYLEKIPKPFRGEAAYRTLISNCISINNQKKAEEIFTKMKQLNIATSSFTCNQMIILYKRTDKKKISDILLYMEKENIKPTQGTYRILIDTKGMYNDVAGMDEIVEAMKADGVEPDLSTKAVLAKHYVAAGLKDKAESVLKEMEANKSDIRGICSSLIPLYASLGKADEVERIWNICEPNPQFFEYLAAIDAWGKLKQIEKAEAIFEKLAKQKKLSSRHYSTMLRVYANNKMLNKGKDLIRRMGESGCRIGPLTWDALVKLYVEAGEVEKADSILLKAGQQSNSVKPLFSSYMTVMEHYSRRGNIHNTEKMLHRLKQAGYGSRLRPFQVLLQCYIKAKTPPYGFRERMMAENIFPNKSVNFQLSQADPFKKTAVSDLLD